jgi:hypothetical protein
MWYWKLVPMAWEVESVSADFDNGYPNEMDGCVLTRTRETDDAMSDITACWVCVCCGSLMMMISFGS